MNAMVGALASATLQGAVLVAATWLVLAALPRVPARVRAWVWWLVAARLVCALLPLPAVPLPWSPPVPAWAAAALAPAPSFEGPTTAATPPPAQQPPAVVPAGQGVAAVPQPTAIWTVSWRQVGLAGLGLVYLVGLGWQGRTAVLEWRRLRRLADDASGAPVVLRGHVDRLAVRMTVPPPDVLTHPSVRSPLVLGVVRPALVLPAHAVDWPSDDLDLAVAHELAHLRRHDLRLAWLPALVQRLFFFDPFARLAIREYALAREAACDADALRVLGCSPQRYGRMLLRLGCTPHVPLYAAASAAPTFTALKRRLVMLNRASVRPSRAWWTLVALAGAALVPFTLAAAPVLPLPSSNGSGGLLAAARARADSFAITGAWRQDDRVPPAPPTPPAPPAPPAPTASEAPHAPPAPPAPPQPPPETGTLHVGGDLPWVLFDEGDSNRSMNAADGRGYDEASRERRGTEAMVWFRLDDGAWVSRDPALLQRIRDSFARVEAIGAQLSAAGKRQGAIGATQGRIGADQGERGARQGALGARIAKLSGQMMVIEGERLQSGDRVATTEQRERLAALRREIDEVRKEMEALGAEQRALSASMQAQAGVMEEEGRRMRTLGDDMQAAVAAARAEAAAALRNAAASGQAQRVGR